MTPSHHPDSEALALLVERSLGQSGNALALRALVEEASEVGASRALARLGLADAGAGGDIHELRQLLLAWRDMRRVVRRAVIGWIVKLLATALLIGLLVELKIGRLFGIDSQ
ncbi:MAG: hypothetical protein D6782_05910 [Alphaproteobacteria bacterium]|nr:MAG: hypothetical protein D6782_05910 [Alphaproteobacteria bacterium]